MAPKKKGTKMSLGEFQGPSNWADDDTEDLLLVDIKFPSKPPFCAYIKSLAFDVEKEDLAKQFPDSIDQKVYTKDDGTSKGCALVEFKDVEGLKNAIRMNGRMLKDRAMRIEVSEREIQRSSRPMGMSREVSDWRSGPSTSDEPRSGGDRGSAFQGWRDQPQQQQPQREGGKEGGKEGREGGGKGGRKGPPRERPEFSRDAFGGSVDDTSAPPPSQQQQQHHAPRPQRDRPELSRNTLGSELSQPAAPQQQQPSRRPSRPEFSRDRMGEGIEHERPERPERAERAERAAPERRKKEYATTAPTRDFFGATTKEDDRSDTRPSRPRRDSGGMNGLDREREQPREQPRRSPEEEARVRTGGWDDEDVGEFEEIAARETEAAREREAADGHGSRREDRRWDRDGPRKGGGYSSRAGNWRDERREDRRDDWREDRREDRRDDYRREERRNRDDYERREERREERRNRDEEREKEKPRERDWEAFEREREEITKEAIKERRKHQQKKEKAAPQQSKDGWVTPVTKTKPVNETGNKGPKKEQSNCTNIFGALAGKKR